MKKKIAVLGATGSIGKSTLDIIRKKKDCLEPVLFSALKNYAGLLSLKKEFPGSAAVIACSECNKEPAQDGIDFWGREGLLTAIEQSEAGITVNGITGAAGLEPSLAAIKAGSHLALANKESIVMAGHFIFSFAEKNNVRILPVDSEIMAVNKLLEAHGKENVAEIILTASGGPFRNYPPEKLAEVNPAQALAHPTWNMGAKISLDSASLANKGLEVIETARYFGFPPEKIKVAIHPQSIVHSMLRLKNGAVYAQMSKPDMRLTIQDALLWPETEESGINSLDFDSLSLTFEKPDIERFPMLALAYESLEGDPLLPTAYNAANEIAADAFLNGKIRFLEIKNVVEYVLRHEFSPQDFQENGLGEDEKLNIEKVLDRDRKARELAVNFIRSL